MPSQQARYWILTIKYGTFTQSRFVALGTNDGSDTLSYVGGQLEIGSGASGGETQRLLGNARPSGDDSLESTSHAESTESGMGSGQRGMREVYGIPEGHKRPLDCSPSELAALYESVTEPLESRDPASVNGYTHWQLVVGYKKPTSLARVKFRFGTEAHAEPTKSDAARTYVFKCETGIEGSQFELGSYPLRRNSAVDWEEVRDLAKRGDLEKLPANVYVQHYRTLKQIACDNLKPQAIERKVIVFWGKTGTGKSRRAWEEASLDAYPKDPRTKFWDGYKQHENVVIDEFRGDIDIAHMLRWLDRYPVNIEVKGSSTTLTARTIWITSNISPSAWYPNTDAETLRAFLRRLTEITEFTE